MSVLSTPRITFRGQISWDPIVTNNYSANYDEATGDILPASDPAAAFREAAIDSVPRGNWNPHGTHRSTFYETFITGVELGIGEQVKDPFVGVPVTFSGMLVDLEPYGATTSQLFFDDMHFGIEGGCSIAAQRAFRFTDRYINFARNTSNAMIAGRAGVTWQTCFPKASLKLDVHDSPVLKAFADALKDPRVLGLMVRWQAYRTVYYDDPTLTDRDANNTTPPATMARQQALQDKLKVGGWQPNPARSLLVGSIGLWHAEDPVHEPGDRALIPVGKPLSDGTRFGPAFARFNPCSLALDLGNFVAESDRSATKQDVGTLTVVVVDPSDKKTVLATLGSIPYSQYNQAEYEAGAGIVTLSGITAEMIAIAQKADLQIRDGSGRALASEDAMRAYSSDPNLYMDENSAAASCVRVYQRGSPVGKDLPVQLAEFSVDSNNNPTAILVGQPQKTDETGTVTFQFSAQKPGIVQYGFGLDGKAPPAALASTAVNFMSVRVWPLDTQIAVLQPTWENVYKYVLSNWYAMAPCMDNWLMLNDPAMVARYGSIVKRLTSASNFESFRYMPVTRDLSPGKRTLLYNYLEGFAAVAPAVSTLVHTAVPQVGDNVIEVLPGKHPRPSLLPTKTQKLA